MDRECCSTSCPISSDPRQLASTLAICNSTSQIAAAWCTGTCLHVGFIWWHRARPRVTLLISSQVDKKNPQVVFYVLCMEWSPIRYQLFLLFSYPYIPFLFIIPQTSLWVAKKSNLYSTLYVLMPYNLEILIKNDEHQFLCNYRCHRISFNTCFLVLGRNPLKSP